MFWDKRNTGPAYTITCNIFLTRNTDSAKLRLNTVNFNCLVSITLSSHLYMNIRPAIFWRRCIPRSFHAATLAIGEPSSSKAITRIDGSRFASHSTSTSTNAPTKRKHKNFSPPNEKPSDVKDKKKQSYGRRTMNKKKKMFPPIKPRNHEEKSQVPPTKKETESISKGPIV